MDKWLVVGDQQLVFKQGWLIPPDFLKTSESA
jgi:hypothetical protein